MTYDPNKDINIAWMTAKAEAEYADMLQKELDELMEENKKLKEQIVELEVPCNEVTKRMLKLRK